MTNKELIEAHDKGTGYCSIATHMRRESPTYNQILDLDWEIVPDILEYLRDNKRGMNIMLLLWDITKLKADSPYKPDCVKDSCIVAYDVPKAREAWLAWGKENGFL